MPAPFGRREDRDGVPCIVYDIELAHPRERVWHAVTTNEGLAPWIGELDGDPSTGACEFRMTAEGADAPPTPVEVRRCAPPEALDVRVGMGGGLDVWDLGVDLAESDAGTRLTFLHRAHDTTGIDLVGPGWEYYLDRLRVQLDGGDLATVDFAEYLPNQQHYADAFGVPLSPMPGADAE